MSDAAPLFERVLRDLARPALSLERARLVFVREMATAVTTGELRPSAGAAALSYFSTDAGHALDALLPFVAIMSDYDDLPHRRSEFDAQIVEAAQDSLTRWRESPPADL
jgi:hypothetical protein